MIVSKSLTVLRATGAFGLLIGLRMLQFRREESEVLQSSKNSQSF